MGILAEGQLLGYAKVIRVLNMYAPYSIRLEYWEIVFEYGIMDDRSLIVARDFNLTLSQDEVWGTEKIDDPIAVFFKTKM